MPKRRNKIVFEACQNIPPTSLVMPRIDDLSLLLKELRSWSLDIAVALDGGSVIDFNNVGDLCDFFYTQGAMAAAAKECAYEVADVGVIESVE